MHTTVYDIKFIRISWFFFAELGHGRPPVCGCGDTDDGLGVRHGLVAPQQPRVQAVPVPDPRHLLLFGLHPDPALAGPLPGRRLPRLVHLPQAGFIFVQHY